MPHSVTVISVVMNNTTVFIIVTIFIGRLPNLAGFSSEHNYQSILDKKVYKWGY